MKINYSKYPEFIVDSGVDELVVNAILDLADESLERRGFKATFKLENRVKGSDSELEFLPVLVIAKEQSQNPRAGMVVARKYYLNSRLTVGRNEGGSLVVRLRKNPELTFTREVD